MLKNTSAKPSNLPITEKRLYEKNGKDYSPTFIFPVVLGEGKLARNMEYSVSALAESVVAVRVHAH